MSLGPLAGLAGTSLAQAKGSDIDRTGQSAANHERRVTNLERAELASGIGQADGEDHETADHHPVCLLSHRCPSYRLRFLATG